MVYVKFDARKDGISTIRQSNDSTACATNAVPITTTLSTIKMCSRKHSSPQIERIQLPLCLAWACTIQVQGLTLDKLVISFELHRQKSFNPGQIYLALSRVKSIEGLFILGNFDQKYIKVDQRLTREYDRLRNKSVPSISTHMTPQQDNIFMTLLSVRSLGKHYKDLKFDPYAVACDMLLLTEPQLYPNELTNSNSNRSLCHLQFIGSHTRSISKA